MFCMCGFRTHAAALAGLLLASLALASDVCPPACPVDGPCYQEVCKKVCVPTTEQVKKVTPVYRLKCEDLCLPRCSFFSCLRSKSSCDECGTCAKCGKPREVRRLVKKFETEEECKVKCLVEHRLELVKSKKWKVGCAVECGDEMAAPSPAAEPLPPPLPKNP